MSDLTLDTPDLQVSFADRLAEAEGLYLRTALAHAVARTRISEIDSELAELVEPDALQRMASKGMRGELAFPTPSILQQSPRLLAYYRLLLGYSQKSFYGKATGLSAFKAMETSGKLSAKAHDRLNELCKLLCGHASYFVLAIGDGQLNPRFLEDLTLITLGPQLRGGKNNQIGGSATVDVFKIIHQIVQPAVTSATPNQLTLTNAAGRQVTIRFAADPDIVIHESIGAAKQRRLVAIEIKGGTDASNLYNRLGEAEKSHQKAKSSEFIECWTVVNVSHFDESIARKNTPTTNKFFVLHRLQVKTSAEFNEFRELIVSLTGIK